MIHREVLRYRAMLVAILLTGSPLAGCSKSSDGPANEPPTAVLRADRASGEAPLSVTFDSSGSYDFDGTIVTRSYVFGDGASGEGVTAQHTFAAAGNFAVVLTVLDDDGAQGQASTVIRVTAPNNTPPSAIADATPRSGDAPLTVQFSGARSSDPDGSIVSYAWSFGDGENGSGAEVSHVYPQAGHFRATLTVTDDGNAQDTAEVAIAVSSQGNFPPQAVISALPSSGPPPLVVALDGSASSDPDGTIASFDWDFGDGHTGSGARVEHTFTADGIYSVTLTVRDEQGATGAAGTLIRVQTVNAGSIIVDHTSLALFGQLPPSAIESAKRLRSLFLHASVGGTILTALRCLAGEMDNRAYCAALSDPRYDYQNWVWQPHASGGCEGKLQDLVDAVAAQPDFDVYHQKYCYFEGLDAIGCCGNIDACLQACPGQPDPTACEQRCEQTFQTKLDDFVDLYVSTMNQLEADHPDKRFVWWTIPYAIGDERCAHEFNQRLRQYANEHEKALFDIGDIEAHDHLDRLVTTGGHESVHPYYCGEFKSNAQAASCHPDFPYDVIWDSDDLIEPECGEGGNIRLAKAYWVLMARLAGWQP